MKKILCATFAICLLSSPAMAQEAAEQGSSQAISATVSVAAPEVMMIKGTIIDTACAEANKMDLANFLKTHTKDCAMMANCQASGYNLYTEGKVVKLDKASQMIAENFLKGDSSKLDVVLEARLVGDELIIVAIKNQE